MIKMCLYIFFTCTGSLYSKCVSLSAGVSGKEGRISQEEKSVGEDNEGEENLVVNCIKMLYCFVLLFTCTGVVSLCSTFATYTSLFGCRSFWG